MLCNAAFLPWSSEILPVKHKPKLVRLTVLTTMLVAGSAAFTPSHEPHYESYVFEEFWDQYGIRNAGSEALDSPRLVESIPDRVARSIARASSNW